MQDAADIVISQILSSRLCHDLIAPLSAVKNGLELLGESQGAENDAEVIGLVMQSADALSRRLSFFRFAFGYSSINGVKSLDDVRTVIENYIEPAKHQLLWLLEPGFMASTEAVKHWAKLIVNLLSICVDVTPYGAKLEVKFHGADDLSVRVAPQSAKLQPEVKAVLEQGCAPSEVTVRTVQAYFCYCWLQILGKKLLVEEHPQQLLFRLH